MIQKYIITLLFLFQLLIEINCQTSPYIHKQRQGHTATLLDNKLYILGGDDGGKDFFYIDFSAPFNTQNLLIEDLSSVNTIPERSNAVSAKGGANNNTLFICGGGEGEMVYTFNPQNNLWIIPKIAGQVPPPPSLYNTTGIIDYNGIMYFWDGIGSNMIILDTIKLIWKKGSSLGAPNNGHGSAATLLPDNKIIYMGGALDKSTLMNQVYIYDTVNDNWSTKITSGTVPSTRYGLSAVLGLDGQRVIVFGGFENTVTSNLSSQNQLYELSLINFEWRIPKTSGQTPSYRAFHSANVIKDYMVITFGSFSSTENDVLLLRINNYDEYIWTNEFNPSSNMPTASMPPSSLPTISSQLLMQQSDSGTNLKIVGIIFGSLVGLALLYFIVLWTCRKRNNNKQGPSDNENIHNHGREITEEGNYSRNIQNYYNNDHHGVGVVIM
ncbi:hypothetical protein RclHR1_10470012 [Rhizophagus clarus]|uniref:Galactose oxidase n=1 Tax=Rhizophagus clarus TaxID=94130 RepID=A0A2Z6Q1Z3_9GLOM|nr:hypothetical protein RclHR1_10470012 [Rhizophagus clarus]GES93117.1 hypothetical protein GLOIN_2v1780026 [Rhizophagus clarus]